MDIEVKDPEKVYSCVYSLMMFGGAMANIANAREDYVSKELVARTGMTIVRCVGTLMDSLEGGEEFDLLTQKVHDDLDQIAEVVSEALDEIEKEQGECDE